MKGFFVFCLATVIISVSSTNIKSVLDLNKEFAKNNTGRSSRVVSGQPTSDGQFPHQVRITIYANSEEYPLIVGWCGGSIIAEQWVLTTSHCLTLCNDESDAPVYYIEAGSIKAGHPRQETSVPFTDAYPHPEFDPDYFTNDIGLLKTENFDFSTPFVQPIPLVAADTSSATYVGLYITVSGFGYISNTGPTSEQVLFTHYLKVISMDMCMKQYAEDAVSLTAFCAQNFVAPVTAVCYGDAGGPAIIQMDGIMILVGIVSFGIKGGCDKAAQGFTNVAQYTVWIQDMMANN